MTFCSTNNFLLMKLLPIHCSWGAPISEKRPKSRILHYITKKVDFRNNGFRAKRGAVWRLASWGMAFLLKQLCSRTTFIYHKKFAWERYKTWGVTPGVVDRAADYGHKGPGFESWPHQKSFRDGSCGTEFWQILLHWRLSGAILKGLNTSLEFTTLLEFLSYA